jgi:hypothetical protein
MAIESSSVNGEKLEASRVYGDIEHAEIDRLAEKRLIRKLDFHIIPITMLLYLFSFLDRVNIGNAR